MSRRRGFPVMPGNFDCPPAEGNDPPPAISRRSSIHRHFNPYRVAGSEPGPSTGGAGTVAPMGDSEAPDSGATDLGSLRRRIGDLRRTTAHEAPSNGRSPSDLAAAASARARWARTSAARSARSRLNQHRLRRRNEEDSIGTVQEAVDRLNEATSDLSSILDDPLPQIFSSDNLIGLVPDTETLERRHKLRKLDSDALDMEPPPKYGYYGQVVPGRLKMSILGCDGGYLTERDDNSLHRHYSPENILRNDKSVYCTEKDQCNIIFKHWKDTSFALTKVVIKTPDTGFTAPVQEGLIFVSMSAEDLLPRTSQYQIIRTAPTVPSDPPYGTDAQSREVTDFISRYAELRPHLQTSGIRTPSQRRGHSATPTISSNTVATDWAPFSPGAWISNQVEAYEAEVYREQGLSQTARRTSPGENGALDFTVTSTCNEPSDDEEETTSPEILHDRQRRRRLGIEIEWPSSDDDSDGSTRRHRRRRASPREIRPSPKPRGHNDRSDGSIAPHARFFIERKRNVVSVKFDPPVTGRYVLVKMWSPEDRDNIDVQSISIYGFAGQRFIPAIQHQ